MKKYERKVTVIGAEEFGVIDFKGRLQLKTKSQFYKESLGLGSFYKTLFEKGHLERFKKDGAKYLYLQPLNNISGKLLDFDMMDILLSSCEINQEEQGKGGKILLESLYNSSDMKSYTVNSRSYINSEIETKNKVPKFLQQSHVIDNRHKVNRLGLSTEWGNSNLAIDCISKVYDFGGDLALKVHDRPDDQLNSTKFLNTELGINYNKLHSGETIFSLQMLLDKQFLKDYNYGTNHNNTPNYLYFITFSYITQ